MKPTHRQTVLLIGFMVMLAAVFLFLFVYAPNPLRLPRPDLPTFKQVLDWMLETFNIFNYL